MYANVILVQITILYMSYVLGNYISRNTRFNNVVKTYLGYSIFNLIYLFGLKIGLVSSTKVAFASLILPAIYVFGKLLIKFRTREASKEIIVSLIFYITSLIIACFAILRKLQTFEDATKNVYKYWHSANNDIFDALCGAKAILSLGTEGLHNINAISNLNTIEFSPNWICTEDPSKYLDSINPLQYSNMAFISQLGNLQPSMISYLVQAFIYLVFFIGALTHFCEVVLKLNRKNSVAFSILISLSHFYFVTLLNGHIGTQMVAAGIVLAVNILSQKSNLNLKDIWPTITILSLFMLFTYPYILPIIAGLILVVYVFDRNKNIKSIAWLVVLAILSALILFLLSAEIRVKAETNFRAWGSITTWLLPYQYLGVLPGNIVNAGFLGEIQQFIIRYQIPESFLKIFSLIFVLAPSILVLKKLFSMGNKFIFILVNYSIFISIFVYLLSRDSYFVYKTLYIFQFIIFGATIFACRHIEIKQRITLKARKILWFSTAFLLAINMGWNILTSVEYFKLYEENRSLASSILSIDLKSLNQSISTDTESPQSLIASYLLSYLRNNEIENPVNPINVLTVTSEKQDMKYITKRLPDDYFLISSSEISQKELQNNVMFRWVSSYNKNSSIKVERINTTNRQITVTMCARLPEFGIIEEMNLDFTEENGKIFTTKKITKRTTCFEINVLPSTDKFLIKYEEVGSRPSVFDGRKLLFQILKPHNSNKSIF